LLAKRARAEAWEARLSDAFEERRKSGGRVFALTGGIGSGKSAVARILREEGIPVVDADALARAVVQAGSPALEEIVEAFGARMLTPGGDIDRARLGALVFSDETARKRLNAIVHPRVRDAARAQFTDLRGAGHPWICYEIPLLFETGQEANFRPVIVVSAPEQRVVERIVARDGVNEFDARARISAQIPLAEKVKRA